MWAIFIYMVCTFEFKTTSFGRITILGIGTDKIAHFILFSILAFALIWGFNKSKSFNWQIVVAFIISSVYGIAIEICQQYFTATRQADILDILADSIGAICGIALFLIIKKLNK